MASKPDDDDYEMKEEEEEPVKSKETSKKKSKSKKKKQKKKKQQEEEKEEEEERIDSHKEKFTFFYGTASPFSQWHPAEFEVDGIQFNCCEQFMMYQKAILFKDDAMAEKIMKSAEPREQKALGRRVSNFVDSVWKEKCREIVKRGNMAKFSQNPDIKRDLLATVGTSLVEASPRDRIWGIGLGANNHKAQDRKTWRGSNWLGEALTEVRDELLKGAGK